MRASIGKPTAVAHQDIVADVELKISAKQGPNDPAERMAWLAAVRKYFEGEGYESRLYYRHIGGGMLSGEVHRSLAGATDLVMCQKELISLKKNPKDWYSKIASDVQEQMIELLNTEGLWERSE